MCGSLLSFPKRTRCDVCLDLSSEAYHDFATPLSQGPAMTRTMQDFRCAALNGCARCSLLLEGIEHFFQPDSICDVNILRQDFQKKSPLHMRVNMKDSTLERIEFYSYLPSQSPWPMIGVDHLRTSHGIGANLAFVKILDWIKECTEDHDKCDSGSETLLPTRVLDVGTSDTDVVKLYETRGELDRYVCLSYCWGPVSFLKTEKESLGRLSGGIPWSSLTKTFQDAILFIRKLQIRWLWIDALCIIQDDPDDWDKEAANMASIYRNSYMTLAATSSKDGKGGLFFPEMDYELKASSKSGSHHRIHVRNIGDHHWWGGRGGKKPSQDLFPLFYRGWCYQERLLSPRLLHFGRNEVFWECRATSHCDCETLDNCGSLKSSIHEQLQEEAKSWTGAAWRGIVSEYTTLSLTFASDRLAALSGIAKMMQKEPTDYLAGIWRQDLPQDLLWHTLHKDPVDKQAPWRAPSWSWASADGAVTFCGPSTSVEMGFNIRKECWHANVVEATCVPKGRDPTGQVISGSLQVQGPLVEAELFIKQSTDSPDRFYVKSVADSSLHISSHDWEHMLHIDRLLPHEQAELTTSSALRLYCLGMVTYEAWYTPLYDYDVYFYTFYLVLRCLDERAQKYERMGLAWQEMTFGKYTNRIGNREHGGLSDTGTGNIFAKANTNNLITIV